MEQLGLLQGVAMPVEFLELRLAVLELRAQMLWHRSECSRIYRESRDRALAAQKEQRDRMPDLPSAVGLEHWPEPPAPLDPLPPRWPQ